MASAGIAANQAREEHILLLIAKKQQEIRHLREELKALAVQKAKMKKAEAKAEADRAAAGGANPPAVKPKVKVAVAAKAVAAKPKGAVAALANPLAKPKGAVAAIAKPLASLARSKGAVKKLQLKTSKPSCRDVADGRCRGLHKDPQYKYMVGVSKEGIQYGPGYECWQCMHQARGGKGGHVHSCNKTPYAR